MAACASVTFSGSQKPQASIRGFERGCKNVYVQVLTFCDYESFKNLSKALCIPYRRAHGDLLSSRKINLLKRRTFQSFCEYKKCFKRLKFQNILLHPFIQRFTDLDFRCSTVMDMTLKTFLLNCKNIQSINLRNCLHLKDPTLKILSLCKNLKILNISGCTAFTSAGLCFLAACENLERLIAGEVNISNACLSLLGAKGRLIELQVPNTSITNEDLSSLSACQNLQHLDVSFCSKLTAEWFHCMHKFPNLLTFCANGTQIDDLGVQSLLHCRKLKYFSVSYCGNISKSLVPPIS